MCEFSIVKIRRRDAESDLEGSLKFADETAPEFVGSGEPVAQLSAVDGMLFLRRALR
jgi:hypothetical protein